MIPAQGAASRVKDDADLRSRLVVMARVAAGSAASVLAAGFVLVALDHGSSSTPLQASSAPSAKPSPVTAATSDAGGAADPTPNGSPTSPVSWRVQSTGDRTKDAAIIGYKNYLGTAVRLGETPDPADPSLPKVAVEPELSRFRRALSVSSDADLSRRGRVAATARLMSLKGNQAVVIGCTDSSAQRLFDGQAGQQAWRGGTVVTAAHLRLRAGRWRVYQLTLTARVPCLN